jgi:hypothetical protein
MYFAQLMCIMKEKDVVFKSWISWCHLTKDGLILPMQVNECLHAFPPFFLSLLVPLVGFKPSTMNLRVKCSTTVLLGQSQKWMKAYLKLSDQRKIRCKREKIMGKHVDILSRAHTWSSKAFLSLFCLIVP